MNTLLGTEAASPDPGEPGPAAGPAAGPAGSGAGGRPGAGPAAPAPGTLYVPVVPCPEGQWRLRFLRTPLGVRTAVGFSRPELLAEVLGDGQRWVRLAEPALRALAEPLGVSVLTVDPRLLAAAPGGFRRTRSAHPCFRRAEPEPEREREPWPGETAVRAAGPVPPQGG
jgi:hypothetical protein